MITPSEPALRQAFARWLRGRLRRLGIPEDVFEQSIGRPSGWLVRYEEAIAIDALSWIEAWRVIALVGEDPSRVIRSLVADLAAFSTQD